MKQKKGNVSLKSPANGANDSIVKNQKAVAPKTPAKATPAKATPKKMAKTPQKVVPPKEVEEEEEDDSAEEEDSGADVAAGVPEGMEVSEGDEDDDEDAENGEDESGDDGPEEAPVGKESVGSTPKPKKGKKTKTDSETGVPQIKTGALPKTFPKNQVLVVKNLPKVYKQIDIVEVFAKFGTLHTIYNNHGPTGSVAFVAYHSPEEAQAAQLATHQIAKVKGLTISVNLLLSDKKIKDAEERKKLAEEKKAQYEEKQRMIDESKDRTVYIKNIKRTTTEDQIKEHFAECGDIESIRKVIRPQSSYAFITFNDEASVSTALTRHNTVLDGMNIWVLKSERNVKEVSRDPQRTVLVKNKQNLECVENGKLEAIFSKCGEIEDLSILCKKNVLAFVTYKDIKSAKKALKLNGTTADEIELEVEEYKVITPKSRLAIFIQNVKLGVTEEEIRELFAGCGQIENVVVHPNGYAIVRFEDIDGFCKSFALNETTLHGNILFLEPYSEKKQIILKKKHSSPFNRKRASGGPFHKGGYGKKRKLI